MTEAELLEQERTVAKDVGGVLCVRIRCDGVSLGIVVVRLQG